MKPDLLPLEEAIRRVLAEAQPLGSERIPLKNAARRVLAEALVARHPLPPEDASLMDGYAVRASEVAPGKPLAVAFEVAAGHAAPRALGPGECARIFTGGAIPPGADAVVMQEHAQRTGDRVTFDLASTAGEHVRKAGSDAAQGAILLRAGEFLDAGGLSLAATAGGADVLVGKRPVVAILATGDELVSPGAPLGRGQIHESNTVGLALEAEDAGAIAKVLGHAPDSTEAIAAKLKESRADVLVTSGGASVGDYDFARAVLEKLGGRCVFWQVAIRPGKPVLFGVIEGERRQLFFALPGNPGASALTFDLFVRPALLKMMGAETLRRPRIRARLKEAVKKPEHLTFLARGRLVAEDGTLHFTQAQLQGSMSVASQHGLGALAIVPAGIAQLAAGALVEVEPWLPPTPA